MKKMGKGMMVTIRQQFIIGSERKGGERNGKEE